MKKLLLLPLLAVLLFTNCEKQLPTDKLPEGTGNAAKKSAANKIAVCHLDENGTSNIINISIKAWPAHQAHGDVRVDDQDGDGYVPNNACGYGQMGDCDDLNASVNPGATEICGNGIDDNCNGKVDEDCFPSVTICDQTWMLKNLDVSTYRNGDPIPEVQDQDVWNSLTTGSWCYFYNDAAYGPTFGKLYNWYAVNDPRGLAPDGWHIPTEAEWITLTDCLGGESKAGGKMKATGYYEDGTGLWRDPNTDATNVSNFTGLPGGLRFAFFGGVYGSGYWWSSTESSSTTARWRNLKYNSGSVFGNASFSNLPKYCGMSVRCVKD